MTFVLGFTGTRDGMTDAQELMVWECLKRWRPTKLRHGDCRGADAQAHMLAIREGVYTIVHPPLDERWRAFCVADEVLEPRAYIQRDHDIVEESLALLAAPRTATEELRSGTWATIRYAWQRHRPVVIVGPDGRIVEER